MSDLIPPPPVSPVRRTIEAIDTYANVITIGGFTGLVIGFLVWLFSELPMLGVGLMMFSLGALCVVMVGHFSVSHSEPVLSLGNLSADGHEKPSTPQTVPALSAKPELQKPEMSALTPASPKPQPNIIMAGHPRITSVIWDTNYVFHEDRVSPKARRALVVDFRNELEQGKEIKSLESVKSQLTYSYGPGPWLSERVNRGFWLDHEYTHTDFQRGDTRTLLIGIIIPDPDGRDALMVYDDNKRESESDPIRQPGTITFGKYDTLRIKLALFTQTRHRFHKECEFELGKDGHRQITKPFA